MKDKKAVIYGIVGLVGGFIIGMIFSTFTAISIFKEFANDRDDTKPATVQEQQSPIIEEQVLTTNSFEYDEELYEDDLGEGEPTLEDFMRKPHEYVMYSHHFENVNVEFYHEIYGSLIDPTPLGTSDSLLHVYKCNSSEGEFLLLNAEKVLGYKLLEGDVLESIQTEFVGYSEMLSLPVLALTDIEE